MQIFQGLLTLILVLIIAVIGVGYSLPQRAQLERSIEIARDPAFVFARLNSFADFAAWSPWASLDPAMQVRIEGPAQGVGARYSWTSEQQSVGSGSQEIVESVPHRLVRVRLQFSGMDSISHASYQLRAQGEGTHLTWTHEAEFGNSLLARYFGLLLDDMVGSDYERGLQRLKAHLETLPRDGTAPAALEPASTAVPASE